jgi:hypothetical protein
VIGDNVWLETDRLTTSGPRRLRDVDFGHGFWTLLATLAAGSEACRRTAATGLGNVVGPADLPDPLLGRLPGPFQGFSQIMLAFTVRHAGEEAAAIDPAGPR